jgi:hypothetical protein
VALSRALGWSRIELLQLFLKILGASTAFCDEPKLKPAEMFSAKFGDVCALLTSFANAEST